MFVFFIFSCPPDRILVVARNVRYPPRPLVDHGPAKKSWLEDWCKVCGGEGGNVTISLYNNDNVKYSYADARRNIFNTIRTSGHSSLEKYTSHFIRKGSKGLRKILSVRGELETEQNCNILTPTLLAIAAFLSRSPRLLNRGPGVPASVGTWFSFQHLLSNWSEIPVAGVT